MNAPRIEAVLLCLVLAFAGCDTEARERSRTDETPPATGTGGDRTGTGTGTTTGTGITTPERPGTLGPQVTVGGKTVAEWTALRKDEFAQQIDTYLTSLDKRIADADQTVRAELTEKREELRRAQSDLSAAAENTWETTRREILEDMRWLETKLQRK